MIPWDDDIDVLMPRPDYDRLLEIAKKEDFGKYEVVTPYNNESYPLYFSKLVNRGDHSHRGERTSLHHRTLCGYFPIGCYG